MRTVDKSDATVRDLAGHALFLLLDSLDAAERFTMNTEATFRYLAANPRVGRPRDDLDPPWDQLRSWPVEGFPNHLVFYAESATGIRIARVLHAARDIGTAIDEAGH